MTQVAFWYVEDDVIEPYVNGRDRRFRTIIATSGYAPPPGSIVICSPFFFAPTGTISALGRVQRSQAVSTSRVRVRVEPFYLLDNPIRMDDLQRHVDGYTDRYMSEAYKDAICSNPLSPKRFTARSSRMMLAALRTLSQEASLIIDSLLQAQLVLPALDELRLQEERDAFITAFRFSNLPDRLLPPQSSTKTLHAGVAFGRSVDSRFVIDNEDDLLAADLRRFDDSARLMELAGSMFAIQDRNLRLTVMNVNRKDLDRVFGVDLIYYDHINDTAVAVQYKRLKKTKLLRDGAIRTEWVYRDRIQLVSQLDRMERHNVSSALTADDWRLTSSPNFFKFVKAEDFIPNGNMLLKGMYVPDEYLRLGIQEGRFQTGPKGGFQIGYYNTRYFTSSTFIELVRRCWIGTRKTDRSRLARSAAERAEKHEVVLALRNPVAP